MKEFTINTTFIIVEVLMIVIVIALNRYLTFE